MDNNCLYCKTVINNDDFLSCKNCFQDVHIKCLKRPGTPGDLLGDVFFMFTCINCSKNGKEVFTRQKLPWLMVITLTLYNLSITSKGLGHHGFFHRTHIMHFIDKNWNFLFDRTIKRKKKWTGTMTGVLSLYSPDFFTSGQEVLRDSGWWKLTYNQTPKFYLKLYEQVSATRQQLRNDKKNLDENTSSSSVSTTTNEEAKRKQREEEEEICSRIIPYMGRQPKKKKKSSNETNDELNEVQNHLMDFLAENFPSSEMLNNLSNVDSKDLVSFVNVPQDENSIFDLLRPFEGDFNNPEGQNIPDDLSHHLEKIKNEEIPEEEGEELPEEFKPRIVQVTNYQKAEDYSEQNSIDENIYKVPKEEPQSTSEDSENEVEYKCEESLFSKRSKRKWPWLNKMEDNKEENETDSKEDDLRILTEYEEKLLHRQLKGIFNAENELDVKIPSYIRRFYRKLCVRNEKRNNYLPLFDLDLSSENRLTARDKTEILDRYMISTGNIRDKSFHARIVGNTRDEMFESPYTSRILHPYIYRHSKCFPPWLKLMCELQYAVNGQTPSRSTIDFCYVRPHHIGAVNSLLQKLFWPGIDMSECLSYPDFSVIALYKKLVVGCAFLVPDVKYNEAYISFMAVRPGWQRSGIATFMLYHLTQTCMGKDITLHVSATNTAICLYQKFGFKIEEVILDFYEKFLPIESKNSRHAFFLRLKR